MINGLGHAGPTPEFVMRTGAYALMDPVYARQNVSAKFVENWVNRAVGRTPPAPGAFQTVPPPVPTGIIKPKPPIAPGAPAPAPTPSETMAGFLGDFGAPSKIGVAVNVSELRPKYWIYGSATGVGVGALGGLVAGGRGRRLKGSLIGAAAGAGVAALTLLMVRQKAALMLRPEHVVRLAADQARDDDPAFIQQRAYQHALEWAGDYPDWFLNIGQ